MAAKPRHGATPNRANRAQSIGFEAIDLTGIADLDLNRKETRSKRVLFRASTPGANFSESD